MINSYWEESGKFEKKNSILWDKYIPRKGINLTDNNAVNRTIISFRKKSKAYRRYYNDGDRVAGVTHTPTSFTSDRDITDQKKLEHWMDITILKLWKITKGGKVPVTRHRDN